MSVLDPVVKPVVDRVKQPVRWGAGHVLPRAFFRGVKALAAVAGERLVRPVA